MNIIKSLIKRIESRLLETKKPCKSYATEEAAEKATSELAALVSLHLTKNQGNDVVPARYVVFYIESWGRWVGAIDMTELCSRKSFAGGYVGIASDADFYSY